MESKSLPEGSGKAHGQPKEVMAGIAPEFGSHPEPFDVAAQTEDIGLIQRRLPDGIQSQTLLAAD